jgi:2-amino-4-hydroxy-6-hydroxymethyldihydropteridine diphosphokinase
LTVTYLGLGSNLGRRDRNLSAARRRLRQKGARILRHSRVIETEPWGVTNQPRFLNQVLEVEGGRQSTRRWGPRVIDVDILLFGSERISEPDLQIPHPGIAERPFVLDALMELGVQPRIRPDVADPGS